MAQRIQIDPKKQFSKRLARWTAVFWFLYMTWLSCVMLIQPSTAMYVFYMSIVVSVVMIVNVYSYCKNSIAEKVLLAVLDKTKIEVGRGNGITTSSDNGDESENG